MSLRSEKALDLFRKDYNCAQAVLMAFASDIQTDPDVLKKISSGFGGGMGRLQKTCGAVTGAFMVLSLYAGNSCENNNESKDLSRELIRNFHKQFIAIHNVSDCRTLLDCDTNTEKGQALVTELNLSEKVCEACIKDAVYVVETLLGDI